jgi:hypothetical protein
MRLSHVYWIQQIFSAQSFLIKLRMFFETNKRYPHHKTNKKADCDITLLI